MWQKWKEKTKSLKDHEALRAQATVVLSAALFLIFSVALPLRYSVQPLADYAVAQMFVSYLLILIAIVSTWKNPAGLFGRHAFVVAIYLVVLPAAYSNGALQAPAVPILITLPFLGAFLIGVNAALAFGLLSLLTLVVYFTLYVQGFLPEAALKEGATAQKANLVVLGGLQCFATVMAVLYEKSRRKSYQELAQVVELRTQFLASISHEIRTPLGGVMGGIGLLKDANTKGEVDETLQLMSQSGKALQGVVDNFLDFSKLKEEKLTLNPKAYSLRDCFERSVDAFKIQAAQKGLKLILDFSSSAENWVLGDESRVSQIIVNLLSNAIKFTDEGFIKVTVDYHSDGVVEFMVEDSGIGIEKNQQKMIFDPYMQAQKHQTQNFSGTGLGMSITKSLVELMEGSIEVESALGEGTRFTVFIPFATAQRPVVTDAATGIEAKIPQGLAVLLVEDDLVNQKIISRTLERMGLRVHVAENGQVGVDRFQNDTYDFILMDINMPVMNGIEALQVIRGYEQGRSIPIFALTANQLPSQKEEFLQVGFNHVLAKPLDSQKLKDLVDEYFSPQRAKEKVS